MKNFKRLTIFSVTVVTLLIGFCLYYFKIHTDDYFNKEASYYLVNEDHVGTGGYDVTSYFTDGKPLKVTLPMLTNMMVLPTFLPVSITNRFSSAILKNTCLNMEGIVPLVWE